MTSYLLEKIINFVKVLRLRSLIRCGYIFTRFGRLLCPLEKGDHQHHRNAASEEYGGPHRNFACVRGNMAVMPAGVRIAGHQL